jgi:hypothetical protein
MGRFWVAALLAVFVASSADAWHVNTHLELTRDAISLMPPEFQKAFIEHQKYVESGIKDPDHLLRDFQNHYYIPGTPPEGGAIDRIEKIIQVVQTKFKTSSSVEISKQLCYLAHYIADLWTPEYLIKQDVGLDPTFVQNYNIVVVFEGYSEPIQDYREYFTNRANWRWNLENSKQISTLLYSEALNDIARTWLSLWQQSGKPLEPVQRASIEHRKGAISVNYERLLLEEQLTWNQWHTTPGDAIDKMAAHTQEMERLGENVAPSDNALAARAQLRNQEAQMSKLNPAAPFELLETSLKLVGQKAVFVGRVRNKSKSDIASLSFMYPGVKGPFAQLQNLKATQVEKVEGVLPANAAKEQVQIIFASAE